MEAALREMAHDQRENGNSSLEVVEDKGIYEVDKGLDEDDGEE